LKVELIKVNGDWKDIPKFAGISHGKENVKDSKRLLKDLYKWGHMEPFEFVSFVWELTIPVFLERQILRHRISSKVEQSMRYVTLKPSLKDAYLPFSADTAKGEEIAEAYSRCFRAYEKLIEAGVPKEQARVVLPLGLNTKMFVSFNARSFDNFLKLRLNHHAQSEMQVLAYQMLDSLSVHPKSYELYKLYYEKHVSERRG